MFPLKKCFFFRNIDIDQLKRNTHNNFVTKCRRYLNSFLIMNVISRKQLDKFNRKHADARGQVLTWFHKTKSANWSGPQDIKDEHRTADFLKNNIVIFSIKGNKYRLVVKISYKSKTVFIKWIGTHAEYTKQKFE